MTFFCSFSFLLTVYNRKCLQKRTFKIHHGLEWSETFEMSIIDFKS